METRLTDICFAMQVGRRHGGSHSFIGPEKDEKVAKFSLSQLKWREEDRLFCHRTPVRGHHCLLVSPSSVPLPAVAAGVMLRAAGGVSPDSRQCGTLT